MNGGNVYDDYEPEDAWDASDSVDVCLLNLARRVALLDGGPEPSASSTDVLLDLVHERIERRRRTPLVGRDVLRVVQLLEDLRTLRERLP